MRPYIVCHMIESVDGRIDCDMTEKIDDTTHYYDTLDSLGCPSQVEGKTTLAIHYAEHGVFKPSLPVHPAGFRVHKAAEAAGYAVGVDTHGSLLWGYDTESQFGKPLLMLLSEDAPAEYLDYLADRHISYITVGKGAIDLPRAMELLYDHFGIERLAVTGGGHINAAFLAAGLLDEISMLYGAGIDGRAGWAASFDGLPQNTAPTLLKLTHLQQLGDIIWAKYTIKK